VVIVKVPNKRRTRRLRLVVVRQRQQVVEVLAWMDGPRHVARDQDGVDEVDQPSHSRQMSAIDAGRAPMETPIVWTEIGWSEARSSSSPVAW
jgi:hypothetical protein